MDSSIPDRLRRFRVLYDENADFVTNLLGRLAGPDADAEGLAHEVFLVAWRRHNAWEADRRLLVGIALRTALAYRRRARVRRLFAATAAYFVKVDHLTPERLLEGEQDLRLVYSVLDTLPEKKRAVFILFELQGLSGAEIADLLRCPLDTVKTRLHYAREAFFSELEHRQAAEVARSARVLHE